MSSMETKRRPFAVALFIGACCLALFACRRTDPRSTTIHVPDMTGERDVRIVTNAVVNEIWSRLAGPRSDYEVDLGKGIVLCHESSRLMSKPFQRHIEARIREVGFEAHVMGVGHNPPPPIDVGPDRPPLYPWPDRFTAVIRVPGMTTTRAANRVVDAIAFARVGRESEHVTIDRIARSVIVTRYESTLLALKDIEHAVACAGYTANDVPPDVGKAHPPPHGWNAVVVGKRES